MSPGMPCASGLCAPGCGGRLLVGEEDSLVCRLRSRAVPLDGSFIHLTNINDVPTVCKQNEDIYYSPSSEVNGRVTYITSVKH